jgi:signal transduction histidine kinase
VTLVLAVFVIYMVVSTFRRVFHFGPIGRHFFHVRSPGSTFIEPVEYLSFARTLKDLSRRLARTFETSYRVEGAALLLDDERGFFSTPDGGEERISLSAAGELAGTLARINRGVTVEELLVLMNNRQELKTLVERGHDLLLPITRRQTLIAIVLIPKRGAIQRWSDEDISSLTYMKVMLPSLIDRCAMYENEREIQKHQYRMEQLQVMAQLASGLAHEIRNPLSIISTSVETMMKEEVQPGDKRKMLRYIREEAERINVLANKLLSIKLQQKPEMAIVEVRSLCFRLKDFLKYLLRDKNARFHIRPGETCFLYTDATILFQVLLNLALNALEAVAEGGRISIDYRKERTTFTLVVEDDGPGIPPELRAQVFEPFFTTKEKGSGLGLTVTGKLVENLFGRLELLPPGELGGTRFGITLPVFQEQEVKR